MAAVPDGVEGVDGPTEHIENIMANSFFEIEEIILQMQELREAQ